jgi:hypothetical protein
MTMMLQQERNNVVVVSPPPQRVLRLVLYQSIGVTPTVVDMHHTPAPNESNVKAQMKV